MVRTWWMEAGPSLLLRISHLKANRQRQLEWQSVFLVLANRWQKATDFIKDLQQKRNLFEAELQVEVQRLERGTVQAEKETKEQELYCCRT